MWSGADFFAYLEPIHPILPKLLIIAVFGIAATLLLRLVLARPR